MKRPRAKLMRGKPLAERLYVKVEKDPETGCWNWTACVDVHGYGQFRGDGPAWPMLKAHRVSYEIVNGSIPAGLTIDHLCLNKSCVNPDHLEAVTNEENARRAIPVKSVCDHGHPLDGENALVWRGHRMCRACRSEFYRRWYFERGGKEHRLAQERRNVKAA